MNSQTREHIAKYIQLGLSLIPLRGKLPLTRWKEYRFNYRDFANPGVNVGIKAGLLPSSDYLFFVDLDDKGLIGEFYEANPLLLGAPMVSTARGAHVWLSWKEPVKTRVFDKMEIRGNGSYVVVPPSVHPSGHVYRFLVPLRGIPPSYNPGWLSSKAPTPYLSSSATARIKQAVQEKDIHTHIPSGVPHGQRHSTLIRYLGILISTHFREDEATARAVEWNRKNKPPLPQNELLSTVRSCWWKWDLFQ